MNETSGSDGQFADRAMAFLPLAEPSPGLTAAMRAGFETYRTQRRSGLRPALVAGMRRFRDTIWPEAPLWAPVSAFAAALVIGVGLGAAVPAMGNERPRFSLEQPTDFRLVTPDLEEDL